MRLHRVLTAAALTVLASAPLVVSSPAFAQMFFPGLSIRIPSPQTTPQVPMFGGQATIAQTPKPNVQTAQVPDKGEVNASPTFVAPGVDRNATGQIERAM